MFLPHLGPLIPRKNNQIAHGQNPKHKSESKGIMVKEKKLGIKHFKVKSPDCPNPKIVRWIIRSPFHFIVRHVELTLPTLHLFLQCPDLLSFSSTFPFSNLTCSPPSIQSPKFTTQFKAPVARHSTPS